jgi:hypothetical protein
MCALDFATLSSLPTSKVKYEEVGKKNMPKKASVSNSTSRGFLHKLVTNGSV